MSTTRPPHASADSRAHAARSAHTSSRTAAANPPDPATTARALLQEQLRLHRENVPWAMGGALVVSLLFVAMQWSAMPRGPLLAWLGAVLVVALWRGLLWHWQRRSPPGRHSHLAWLWHYRISFAVHGLVWAAASALPMPGNEAMHLAVLVMVLAGVAASNFILNAFDLTAALLFGVPAIGALALKLFSHADPVHHIMGLAVLVALGFFSLTGRRAHRLVCENTALRLAEARQNHLLGLLIETTSEGFWFIDNQAITTDANPAMCQMLGRPRDAVVGRSAYQFLDAGNRAIVAREIARRADGGAAGGYEAALQRPDGSLVECLVHATTIVDAEGQRVGSVGLWTDISERKRTERALQDTSEALRQKSQALEDALGSISQGIVSYGPDGRLRAYNQRMLALLDLPASLFGPHTLHLDVVRFQSTRRDLQQDAEFFDLSGQPQPPPPDLDALPDAYVRRTLSGLLVEVRTLHLPDGGTVRTFSDVTAYILALRALAAREREQRDLLDAFPGYIVVTDHAHRYSYANQRFADLLGRPREQIVGHLGSEVLGAERFARVRATLDRTRPGEPVNTESEYPATAWRPRMFMQVTHAVTVDPASGRRRVYAFAIDISARKAAEAALVAARDEAERANRAKSQFLSSMSHELRTPLNAILGFGHLLATDSQHPLAPAQQAQMAEILHGARHLLQLINEVLDMAVVDTGSLPVHVKPVALAPVLAEALALLQPLAHSRGIQLPVAADGLAADAQALADPVRLKQVLLNLLGNAIKYNHPGGQVRVWCQPLGMSDAGADAAGAGGWRITVQDTGPGLDADQQARLFSAFERLDAGQRGVEGTGLGLALSRGLVRAMGGDIGLHSQPGQGSSFWVHLPGVAGVAGVAAVHAPASPPALPAAASLAAEDPAAAPSQPVVLYIEDNPVNLVLMEAFFERLPGLRLQTATSAEQGLVLATQAPPQLVLLDIQLPGMDGHALLQRLQADPRTRHVPVIAVSADALADTIGRAHQAGFAGYLRKPLDFALLAKTVTEALSHQTPLQAAASGGRTAHAHPPHSAPATK